MNWNHVSTVYRKELKDSLRDRRTLLSMIIIPTLVMPLLVFGMGKIATMVVSKAKDEVPRVMIIGGEDSPGVVEAIKASKKFNVVPADRTCRDLSLRGRAEVRFRYERARAILSRFARTHGESTARQAIAAADVGETL